MGKLLVDKPSARIYTTHVANKPSYRKRENMKYTNKEEALKAAEMENMGRDYGTAVVVQEGEFFIIKIV